MVTHRTGNFFGGGGLSLAYQSWSPDTARAVLVVVHGYAEHVARYGHVAQALAGRGYAVWALDHRGHGRSEGARAHIGHFHEFITDLATFVDLVRQEQPSLPLFMLGHSMGGLIATLYALDQQQQLAGLVLSSPGFDVRGGTPAALLTLGRLLSRVLPALAVGPFNPTLVSRDPAVVAAYVADPLNYHGRVRARLGTELIAMGRSVLPRAGQLRLSLLIVLGDADQLAAPATTRAVFAAAASADKTLRSFPNAHHEILNEPEQAEAIALIGDWLDARC